MSTDPSTQSDQGEDVKNALASRDFYMGLSLALLSTVFIGTSFIFKKKALIRSVRNGVRAGDGGIQYLRDGLWWAGLLLMGIGEGANFLAYAFAPAVLVTPLGGLSVLVSAVLSAKFLDERLNLLGKIGCLLCLIGSTMVVVHAPKEQTVATLKELSSKITDFGFVAYSGIVIFLAAILIFLLAPKYGKTNPMIFVTISGSIGSLSVVACKGIGIGVNEAINGGYSLVLSNGLFWFLLVCLVVNISVQMHYLNRALDIFNTSVITPILYVVFTGFVLTASAILFREWSSLLPVDYIGIILGLIVIVIGILMMNLLKDVDISWRSLSINTIRPGAMAGVRPESHGCVVTRSPRRRLQPEDGKYSFSELKPLTETQFPQVMENTSVVNCLNPQFDIQQPASPKLSLRSFGQYNF